MRTQAGGLSSHHVSTDGLKNFIVCRINFGGSKQAPVSLWEQISQPFIFSRKELFSFFMNYGMTYLMLLWKRLRTLEVSWIVTCLSSSCFGGICALFTLTSFYREWLPTQRLGMLGWLLQGGGSDYMDTSQIAASTPRHHRGQECLGDFYREEEVISWTPARFLLARPGIHPLLKVSRFFSVLSSAVVSSWGFLGG